jgi:hypothetical protein
MLIGWEIASVDLRADALQMAQALAVPRTTPCNSFTEAAKVTLLRVSNISTR